MKIIVNGFNNFCRVFQLPAEMPKGYCFGNGIPTAFIMVDWFNPVPNIPQWAISQEKYSELVSSGDLKKSDDHEVTIEGDELQKSLTDFLMQKVYVKSGRKYIVICDFNFLFMFTGISKIIETQN